MFDIGFTELLMIGIISLIILGPERLPKAARTVGLWIAKAKQAFNSVKTEIDRELKLQELQQQIEQQKHRVESQFALDKIAQQNEEKTQTSRINPLENEQTIHPPDNSKKQLESKSTIPSTTTKAAEQLQSEGHPLITKNTLDD